MRDILIIFVSLIAAVVIGGLLYLFWDPRAQDATVIKSPSGITMKVLGGGQNASSIDTRVNYRITNQADLATLWNMVYGDVGPLVPTVDFTKYEVLGVFDGSHSSGGYGVRITDASDADASRTIHILRTVPGDSCTTTSGITSPFEIVMLPKSDLPLTHVDEMATSSCSN